MRPVSWRSLVTTPSRMNLTLNQCRNIRIILSSCNVYESCSSRPNSLSCYFCNQATNSIQALLRQYQRTLAQWPSDVLRPDISFRKAIQASAEKRLSDVNLPSTGPTAVNGSDSDVDATVELEQVNALCSLLDDRYSKKVRCNFARQQQPC